MRYCLQLIFVLANFMMAFNAQEPIFDSYGNITELEHFTLICPDSTNETCAELWMENSLKILARNYNRIMNVKFQRSTNINKENDRLLRRFLRAKQSIDTQFIRQIHMFDWETFESNVTRQLFETLSPINITYDTNILNRISELGIDISNIYNNARIEINGTRFRAGQNVVIDVFRTEQDYDRLLEAWVSWRNETGAKIRQFYLERMQLTNKLYENTKYPPNAKQQTLYNEFKQHDFHNEMMQVYETILPFYQELHAFVRYCLSENFYRNRFNSTGYIPSHILGDVWAQNWINIHGKIQKCMELVNVSSQQNIYQEADESLKNYTVQDMFELTEEFYESIGWYNMTQSFWERSMFVKPKDKLANCHGSAYNLFNGQDFRIKMCTNKNMADFETAHHEMGHIQYYMAYRHLEIPYQNSANGGFHEAIGDTIALSVTTPEHLKAIGLIKEVPMDFNFNLEVLMTKALDKIAFIPFALTMEMFTWTAYNASVENNKYNKLWWDLREKYQGLTAPTSRSEMDFDPAAKYHISFDVPYARYFASSIFQFQFYEKLCQLSGFDNEESKLNRCDFYGSKEAGYEFIKMLKKGSSEPWTKVLNDFIGSDKMDASSILKYFQPLHTWLKQINSDLRIPVGW